MLLDVCLPDGTALDLLRAFPSTRPRPCVVAMSGAARPEQSFELALSGVRHFLPKPVDSAEEVLAILRRAGSEPPDLAPQLRATVGLRPVQEVEAEVRRVMVGEALARVGTVRGAARLLAVSRQLLQHIRRGLRGEH
jgi:DNA-binding NarL/FixJ family response regulator